MIRSNPKSGPHLRSKLVQCAVIAGLAGCAPQVHLEVAPNILATEWESASVSASPQARIDDSWTAFGSEPLKLLVQQAQGANLDIAIAGTRILQAQAGLKRIRAENGPEFVASASGSSDIRNLQGQTRSLDRIGSAGIDVTYNLDLFGGNRAQRQSARAQLRAAEYERDAVQLAIEAQVVSLFISIAALVEREESLQLALDNVRELERIAQVRASEGIVSDIDIGIYSIEGASLEAEISRLVESRARAKNALAVLLGQEAPLFAFAPPELNELVLPSFAIIQPGELVGRRPDVRAAEVRIEAANGIVAEARAAFMPRLRFSADTFFDVTGVGGIANLGGSLGADLLIPIFDRGRLRAGLNQATAEQLEAVKIYRRTLLSALAEAQNALSASTETQRRLTLLTLAHARSIEAVEIAKRRYAEGVDGFVVVLEASRQSAIATQALAIAKAECLTAAVDLFVAMGGPPSW